MSYLLVIIPQEKEKEFVIQEVEESLVEVLVWLLVIRADHVHERFTGGTKKRGHPIIPHTANIRMVEDRIERLVGYPMKVIDVDWMETLKEWWTSIGPGVQGKFKKSWTRKKEWMAQQESELKMQAERVKETEELVQLLKETEELVDQGMVAFLRSPEAEMDAFLRSPVKAVSATPLQPLPSHCYSVTSPSPVPSDVSNRHQRASPARLRVLHFIKPELSVVIDGHYRLSNACSFR